MEVFAFVATVMFSPHNMTSSTTTIRIHVLASADHTTAITIGEF